MPTQFSPSHTVTSCFLVIRFCYSHICTQRISRSLLPRGFTNSILYEFVMSHVRATRYIHLFNTAILTISGRQFKLRNFFTGSSYFLPQLHVPNLRSFPLIRNCHTLIQHVKIEFVVITKLTHFFNVFISLLYMFRATQCSPSGESIVSIHHLVYITLCRWPSGMQVSDLHTRRPPTQSDIYQMMY